MITFQNASRARAGLTTVFDDSSALRVTRLMFFKWLLLLPAAAKPQEILWSKPGLGLYEPNHYLPFYTQQEWSFNKLSTIEIATESISTNYEIDRSVYKLVLICTEDINRLIVVYPVGSTSNNKGHSGCSSSSNTQPGKPSRTLSHSYSPSASSLGGNNGEDPPEQPYRKKLPDDYQADARGKVGARKYHLVTEEKARELGYSFSSEADTTTRAGTWVLPEEFHELFHENLPGMSLDELYELHENRRQQLLEELKKLLNDPSIQSIPGLTDEMMRSDNDIRMPSCQKPEDPGYYLFRLQLRGSVISSHFDEKTYTLQHDGKWCALNPESNQSSND
ncbi:hypothetical protein [Endozoicomonas euniceicola]|uniref:Uncharacterized protein n=1 Tax=Endozoicomonas euniceicola TaxID=1234143 RepID=A0ABY6GP46_9GAMM|nr:hypothetical protein [Endozoicomonas euniceicola]UYM14526.1 hypothetical protein NX720_16705 [Endozoicomonas euniceicola]